MSTTVKSSELDFNNIKNRLKDYLKKQSEFDDYDFEASGLSNILDVLAYNTHLNALSANFALNESFLASAQLRSSVVSHAETLGYDVRSVTASRALVNLSVNLSGVIGRSSSVILPAGTTFSSQIDGTTYTFNTIEAYVGDDNGSGIYNFYTKSGSFDIPIYEGINKVKNFIVGDKAERQVYVVPDVNIDKQTAVVRVFDTASSSNFINYNDIKTAVNVDANSTLYTIRETPNGFYEMNFGDGISFGKSPDPGNKIELTYLSTKGLEGNSAKVFTPTVTLSVNGANYAISTLTVAESTGGREKQSIESIKQLAPYAYAAQQRLVTSLDYKAIIQSNYTDIEDVSVWSGDQNVPVDYGKVFVSLKFATGTTTATQSAVKNSIVNNFTKNLAVMSIRTEFVDPIETFLELNTEFSFDPALTGNTLTTAESQVYSFQSRYFASNLGRFDTIFRRSNLTTEIDALSPAILSSRIDVKAQLRFVPTIGTSTLHELNFPMKIAIPDDTENTVVSTTFEYLGKIAQLRNKLNSRTLQIYDLDGNVLLDDAGQYIPEKGKVSIIGFKPERLLFGVNYIKLSVKPENQSTIKPLRNYVLSVDPAKSSATAIIDRQTTTLEIDA
jgi:hypothetical protein